MAPSSLAPGSGRSASRMCNHDFQPATLHVFNQKAQNTRPGAICIKCGLPEVFWRLECAAALFQRITGTLEGSDYDWPERRYLLSQIREWLEEEA